MRLLNDLNDFFNENPDVLCIILYSIMALLFLINLASLVHSYNGTRNPFPMVMSAVVMINVILYCPYIYLNLQYKAAKQTNKQ